MIDKSDRIELQVKAPMTITIVIPREQAESLFKDQLAEIIDAILSQCSTEEMVEIAERIEITGGQNIDVDYRIDPFWEMTPEDEIELTYCDDMDLFPTDNLDDRNNR